MRRRVSSAALLALSWGGAACSQDPCRQDQPSVQIDVVADEVQRATSIREIEVRLRYLDRSVVRTFSLEDELFDGKTSLEVMLEPPPTEMFMLELEVEARASGLRLVESTEGMATPDGCNRFAIDLTESTPPSPSDAGVDAGARDAGLPPRDAGVVDAGEPDQGVPEVCGDGIVSESELCDDGNEVEADGCTGCLVDPNFGCSGSPSRCDVWWNPEYTHRQRVTVAVGPNPPYNGYQFYTLRIPGLNTARLIEEGHLSEDCSDLRVIYAGADQEVQGGLARNIIKCGTEDTELHFMSPVDFAAGSLVDRFFVYFGGPPAPAEEGLQTRNVYLFYDDATVDRSGRYTRGRIDDWYGAWDDSLAWNSGGYYTYYSPNDTVSGYRRAVEERDVYAEAEFHHTGCEPQNMVTGLVVRGIIASGSTITESAEHFYFSGRLDQEGCGEGYAQDGDIFRGDWRNTVVDREKPPRIISNVWRKHALAAVGGQTTTLQSWDADQAWVSPGFPNREPFVRGTDTAAAASPGFAGFMTVQDAGRVRGFLVRRFADPEPLVTLGAQERLP